ncbi:MAG: element excision factor XisH family protein [Bacteroidota bacterium]
MPAKDFYHEDVRVALENEGWEITHDPYRIEYEEGKVAIDLGATNML